MQAEKVLKIWPAIPVSYIVLLLSLYCLEPQKSIFNFSLRDLGRDIRCIDTFLAPREHRMLKLDSETNLGNINQVKKK